MFQTDDSWESRSNLQVLRSILGKPGLRQYPLVEVPVNVPVFHVDVLFEGEGVALDIWQRFICYDLATVDELIEQDDVVAVIAGMQTKFVRGRGYEIQKILEIKCVSRGVTGRAYSCTCEDGSKFEDHPINEKDNDAVTIRIILPRV